MPPDPTTDRRVLCWKAGPPGNYRYACTLLLDHDDDNHRDNLTEAPNVIVWAVAR